MKKGLRNVASRITIAQERFLDYVVERGFTRSEAERIYEVYRKAKAIKIDPIGGQFTFTHGAFGDLEVLRLALQQRKSIMMHDSPTQPKIPAAANLTFASEVEETWGEILAKVQQLQSLSMRTRNVSLAAALMTAESHLYDACAALSKASTLARRTT